MTIIELTNGYYIEIDELNYTLKQEYNGLTKDGFLRQGVRTRGYFGNLEQALKKFVKLNQINCTDDEILDLNSYVRRIEESNKDAVYAIARMLRSGG